MKQIVKFLSFIVSVTFLVLLSSFGSLPWAEEVKKAGELEDVVIKAEQSQKSSIDKPPLDVPFDAYETIRDSLKPDESLLMAEHPQAFAWKKIYPDALFNERVIEPLGGIQEDLKIRLNLNEKFNGIFGKVDSKEAKQCQWILTIANEEGKLFHKFEGSGVPAEDLLWNGKSDKGEWVRPGHSYSPVYVFKGADGASHTEIGQPIKFKALVHEEGSGISLSLDARTLFGREQRAKQLETEGQKLLREAADWIKRRHFGSSVKIRTYALDAALADSQAENVKDFIISELAVSPETVTTESASAPSSEQRVDLILLSR